MDSNPRFFRDVAPTLPAKKKRKLMVDLWEDLADEVDTDFVIQQMGEIERRIQEVKEHPEKVKFLTQAEFTAKIHELRKKFAKGASTEKRRSRKSR